MGKYDPLRKHMVVSKGLNLKGKCSNIKCPAFTVHKQSWVRMNYGTFDVSMKRFGNACQNCGEKIAGSSIKTFGFLNAKVIIEGIK